MKVGILALQGDVREHARALEDAGATPLTVKTETELDRADALIIPGGESTTIGKLLDRFELLEPVVERGRKGMPIYGTCAGAILLSNESEGGHPVPHRLGLMDLSVRRNAYGRQVDSFESDLAIAGLDEPFRAVFIRAPSIEHTGPEVEVLATHGDKPVLVRQGRMLASTFHPEMTDDARVHSLFLDLVRES